MSTTTLADDPWVTVDDILEDLGITENTWNKWRGRRCTPLMTRLPNRKLRCRRSVYLAWLAGLDEGGVR